jgi:hypothetical protein
MGRLRDVKPQIPADVLLHAGPPLDDEPAEPVVKAGAQALLFEGRFDNLHAAENYLRGNRDMMRPAQEFGVVTPLAQVVSATMPVVVVGNQREKYCAPLSDGPAPALRFGSSDPACLARLRALSEEISPLVNAHLDRKPIDIADVVADALNQGDECHARTEQANAAVLRDLKTSLPPSMIEKLATNPGFVLPLIMAASAWWLHHNALEADSVTMAGGNGRQFGIKLRGEAGWRTAAATPPVGTMFAGQQSRPPLGAIGDSAVVDFCGLGGQSLAAAPALLEDWKAHLPTDAAERHLMVCEPSTAIVNIRQVMASGLSPIINLAILDASEGGLIGRGFYTPPLSLFAPTFGDGA